MQEHLIIKKYLNEAPDFKSLAKEIISKRSKSKVGVEDENIGIAFCSNLLGGTWKQTSYNGNIRKNYAGIGYTYDETLDAFIAPKPFNSWVLDETTAQWKAPVDMPTDDKRYSWNEETLTWTESIGI